jgi:hypothetical protein
MAGESFMSITSVRCDVLGANVARVTDFEDSVTQIICSEYEESTGLCRLRQHGLSGGPLSQLVERYAENTLDKRATRCVLL